MKTGAEKWIWIRRVLLIIGAYLCVLSMGKLVSFNGNDYVFWGGKYFGYNITAVILFGLTIAIYKRFISRKDRRLCIFAYIGGSLLAVALVYGSYVHHKNDIFISIGESFLQIGMIIALTMLTAPLVAELFVFVDQVSDWYVKKAAPESSKYPKRYFFIIWAIIFVSYIPLFLSSWPGNFIFDAKYQIKNVIDNIHYTHHPLIHTLMLGKAYQFGQMLGDVSVGFQFYTLIQMLILTSSFAYFQQYLYKKQVPRCIRVCSLSWFCLFPMHALFAITSTKDVLCAAFFLYFMVFLVRMFVDKEKFAWYSYVGMIISGVCLALFRNNALYAILVAGIVLILFEKGWKNKGKLCMLFVTILLLFKLVNQGMIAYTGAVTDDNYKESLSVPLQSLARVCSYRGEEVATEVYDEICTYIREEDISAYNPYISDPIKNMANEEKLKNNILNFAKLWVKVGLQFPDEYLESVITNTFGYWYPLNQGVYASEDISLYHTLIGVEGEIEKKDFFPLAGKVYSELFWTNDYHYVPILGYFFRNAPYVWMILLFMVWSWYKKDGRLLMVGALPFLYFGTCLLGPMAALRYIYCLVVCAPLLIVLWISRKENRQIE